MKRIATFALGVSSVALVGYGFIPQDAANGWTLVAWNDLGMHCMDADYSVFSLLPPFNTVWAQLVDPSGNLVAAAGSITLTYEALPDPTGSSNTSSAGKTNYWTYTNALYGGSGVPNTGLAGNDMPGPGNEPQAMPFHAVSSAWIAEGIPVAPVDDDGHIRTYPLMRIVARDALGAELASATPVLPVSSEMDCSACHASGSDPAAMPSAGWEFDGNWERDYRLNILGLHDELHLGESEYVDALVTAGYDPAGLRANVASGTPILCAACHSSNALPGTGLAGIAPLTQALHAGHAEALDPVNGMKLDDSDNRSACYRCHPGSETGCLRGAMGGAVAANGDLAMQCQSCHGNMSQVGDPARVGWLDEPNCQNCHTGTAVHNNGEIRYVDAFEPGGELRIAVDDTFATTHDVPADGFSLYRFSSGHGGLACSACHGSTHAIYPATHPNDNLLSLATQGHVGTLVECASCHTGELETLDGGPHGMHPVGQQWVYDHGGYAEHGEHAQCQSCHGLDYGGTVLSEMHATRTLDVKDDLVRFDRGSRIGCYACHQGPTDGDPTTNRRPVAQPASASTADDPVDIPLLAFDPDGDSLELRVVSQPAWGRVGLAGTTATYHPNPGFAGTDTFTFVAWDGAIDSNLATVTIERGASWLHYGIGYPGTGGAVPSLVPSDPPTLGTSIQISIDNPSGADTLLVAIVSSEPAVIPSGFGGRYLVEPEFVQVVPLSAQGAAFGYPVPPSPSLVGTVQRIQGIEFDPGALFGAAFSAGLQLTFGL